MKNWKSKIVVIALIACIMALSVASTTIAYFTDQESRTNTFTCGSGVEIELTEANDSGVYISAVPGQVTVQNPTVKNVGNDDVYVAGIITLKSNTIFLSDKISVGPAEGKVIITDFLSGGAFANDQQDFLVKATTNGTDVFTVYIIYKNTLPKDGIVQLFDGILVPNSWDRNQMQYMSDLTLTIDAYATQTVGFNSAEEAIKGAFGGGADSTNDHFANYFN